MDQDRTEIVKRLAFSLEERTGRISPIDCAKERGWLDQDGAPTAEGLQVAEALSEQSETRSVFRLS